MKGGYAKGKEEGRSIRKYSCRNPNFQALPGAQDELGCGYSEIPIVELI
jgi:hypothetical protein